MSSLRILLALFFLVHSIAIFAGNQSKDNQKVDKQSADTYNNGKSNRESLEGDVKSAIEIGKRIYREGILSSGEPVRGFVQGDIPITGTHLACVNCHRRSGFGSIEGKVTTPQITGDVLYAPVTSRASEFYQLRKPGEKIRPAYSDDSLAKAIREGKNPAGRQFDKLMPLYTLSSVDMQYLLSYLKTLNSDDSPGVTKTDLHLATVMVQDVPQSKKRAMLRVLYEFIETLNTDTRPKTRRAEHAPWHKKWHYESHRTWKLHVWHLEGPESTWQDQLELLYARDPVFAVVSGIGDDNWQPVHTFCEANEIPCLLPNINTPFVSTDDFYSVYFSQGLTLEAKVLAKHLLNNSKAGVTEKKLPTKIYQVYLGETSGGVPAAILRNALSGRSEFEVVDLSPSDIGSINGKATIVFWMNTKELLALDPGKFDMGQSSIYLSASLVDVNLASNALKGQLKPAPFFIYPYSKPAEMKRKLAASIRWMESRHIPVVDVQLQANTLYTATLLSRVLKHMGSNFSRDYLIERIEHLDKNIVVSPVYPKLTLGPEQRYASTGAYVIKTNGNNSIDVVSDWIVP